MNKIIQDCKVDILHSVVSYTVLFNWNRRILQVRHVDDFAVSEGALPLLERVPQLLCAHREVQKFLPCNRLDGLYISFLRTLPERNIPWRTRDERRRRRFISLRPLFPVVYRRLELVRLDRHTAFFILCLPAASSSTLLRFHSLSLLCK